MTIENRNKSIADLVFFDVARRVPFAELMRIVMIFTAAPGIILFLFFINGYIGFYQGISLFAAIFVLSLLFIHPYIADLKELTNYVNDLSIDKNPHKPELFFINNMQKLSSAIEGLNNSWEEKQRRLNKLLDQEKQTQIILTDFIANASHELKTPLTSLIGFIETIENDKNLTTDQKEFIKIMKSQSERMKKLTADLLILTTLNSRDAKDQYEVFNIIDLLESAIESLGSLIDEKKIQFKTEIEPDIPKIVGNKDEIIRVIENLLSNAFKYSSDGGEVLVKISAENNSKHEFNRFGDDVCLLCFSVIDKGEGISESNIHRLTERFFRVDKARSRKIGGSGLGLAIVKQILDNHNAELKIESILGRGSTFSVFFEGY